MRLFVAKTSVGMEYIAANHVKEKAPDAEVSVRPGGFMGLLLVSNVDREDLLDVPEIERVIPVSIVCNANLNEIVSKAEEITRIAGKFDTFAVRTTKRGKSDFTSIDVNVRLGARIKELTNAEVDLDFPDKAVYVEIIGDTAYIGVVDGKEERKKYTPDKVDSRKFFEKVSVVQLPYLSRGAKEMGERIGRAAQSFEIKELIIAPYGYVDAFEMFEFLKGVRKGQWTRLEIQRKSYERDVREVPVLLQDLYQTARDKRRKRNVLIVTDPTGKQIADVKESLARDIRFAREIVVFVGSRQGIPKGLFRFADYVLDLAPYITFATEHAIPASLIALLGVYEESLKNGSIDDT
jgi:tRNA acetyltransferase TAN1